MKYKRYTIRRVHSILCFNNNYLKKKAKPIRRIKYKILLGSICWSDPENFQIIVCMIDFQIKIKDKVGVHNSTFFKGPVYTWPRQLIKTLK